jgi:carboxyl-terminal processing protease
LSFVIIVGVSYSAISYSQSKNLKLTAPNIINQEEATSDDNQFLQDDNQFLQDIVKRVKKDYVEEKTDKQLIEAAAGGVLSSLDPHSAYLNEDALKEMQEQTKGEFGGVGIEITVEYSMIKVISSIEGTPAEKAGIKSGDYISKIDGKSVVGMKIEEVVKKLRGKPGTKVVVTILRKTEKTPIEVILQRQNIQIKPVRSSKEKDVVYIKINSFSERTYSGVSAELEKIINQIDRDKVKGIVLDLRGNPGGLLDEAVNVSDLFLDKNQVIVSISGRNKDEAKVYKDNSDQILTKDIQMAVLINEGSASASEIVAGALQDNKRAIILGVKSFGKGSVQSVIPLKENRGALKMTTALYYTPSGKSIQAHGIDPDIIIDSTTKLQKADQNPAGSINSEAALEGHLKNQIEDEIKFSKQSKIGDNDLELYNKDYQLSMAIDLLRGISVYRTTKK